MDRNWQKYDLNKNCLGVALRKESVDRNARFRNFGTLRRWSLSARRAWIEIGSAETAKTSIGVALRKESVDRNQVAVHFVGLSAVALRKESVDRNFHTVQVVVVIV